MATLLLLAGVLAAPSVDTGFARRFQQHYPPWAVRENAQTAAAIELTVMPDGKITHCRVLESIGSARLAAEKCAGAVGLKLNSAIGSDGKPIHGVLRTTISLSLDPARNTAAIRAFAPQPDVRLPADRLPDEADHLDMEVAVLVSPEGRVNECEGREARNTPAPSIDLVTAACAQAKGWRGQVLQDATGQAVPYVTNLRVRFAHRVAPEG